MKMKYLLIIIYFFVIKITYADINIINSGKILKSKHYSQNEATLVVSKSKRIYICSVLNDLTQCVQSRKKIKIN